MRLKKHLIFRGLFFSLLFGSMTIASCGGSSGGNEEVFDFTSADLTNKYWYANPYLNENFNTDDAILVYRFNGNGKLEKQEFSGHRDVDAGTWSLEENILTINDESIDDVREWTIDKSSTRSHLFLKSTQGNRDFYTQITGLNDLTADAILVNEVYLEDGNYDSNYRYEFEVKGANVAQAKAILSNVVYDLVEAQNSFGETVWRLSENDSKVYFNNFGGREVIKFYVKMDSEEEFKLEEQMYDQDIEELLYQFVDSDHAAGDGPLSLQVEWKAIDDPNAFYYVQILNSEKDENNPLFTSNWQPASENELQTILLKENTKGEFGLSLGDVFYVKVVAFVFEDGIDPYQGDIHKFNIQAKSQFIRLGGEW